MSVIVSFVLEFARVLIILIIGAALLIGVETWIFSITGKDILEYAWMLGIANFLIIFVVYRNVLQFSGWLKSESNKKLNKLTALVLLGILSF